MQERNKNKFTIILRFLGKTPSSSTITKTLRSIISQIDYLYFKKNLNRNFKNFDSMQLNKLLFDLLRKISKTHPEDKIFIFLDSLDQLNKLDYNLNWFIEKFPSNTRVVYSTLTSDCNIIETLKSKGIREQCFLKLNELDNEIAIKMFSDSITKDGCQLNMQLWNKVSELFQDESTTLYPFFVKLIFDIAKNWYSFTPVPINLLSLQDIYKAIEFIFESIEDEYGQLLVSKCLFYLTLTDDSGISDCEMEDVLSLDEELLAYIFQIQKSPNKRFPITLWNRIKLHLTEYITLNEVDETQVYSW